MKTWMLILMIVLAGPGCKSTDPDDDELAPGEFYAEIDGDVETRIEGTALFAEKERLEGDPVLLLHLTNGTMPSRGPMPPIPTGVFLYTDWNKTPAKIQLGSFTDIYSEVRLKQLIGMYFVTSGTLQITQVTNDQISGSYEVSAPEASGTLGTVTAKGKFIATRGVYKEPSGDIVPK